MQALIAQVDLARIDLPEGPLPPRFPANGQRRAPLSAALLADVRAQTARADREITDGYERQAVITAAAYLLERAGLDGESDALLESQSLEKPLAVLPDVGAGRATPRSAATGPTALHWYREAFEKSEGPATRLQWGASYVNALIDLSPW